MIGQISRVGPLCAAKNPSEPLGHGWIQDLWRRPLVSDTGTSFVFASYRMHQNNLVFIVGSFGLCLFGFFLFVWGFF